ncbi:hypothetical protein LSM04_003349 [Trypanosoma melophagium]|uniref:uncharacterized protein n=1 Tax=Trypanosoma melophagium TaxID=715481 RepID=UPI00351A068D|nr:hypothetical protein LSM04_003349 [Trypanosoma melophagium]
MPQDKRLIITKAVVHKLQRLCNGDEAAAAAEGIFLEFVIPTVVIAQCPDLINAHVFQLPQRTYAMNGRTTCLIVPRVISTDAFKINKRHGYYDAVITAEAICKRDDAEAVRRAVQVANTFSHFVVDARIVSRLPMCILSAAGGGNGNGNGKTAETTEKTKTTKTTTTVGQTSSLARASRKCITALQELDDRTSLTFRLSQGATGGVVRAGQQGQLIFRVGHGGMTAGDVCENAKCFIFALKRDFPTVWKYIHEFKMTSGATEPIRFMEVHIQK